MLGNWAKSWTDANGNGSYSDTNELDERDHNSANELTERRLYGQVPGTPATTLTLPLTLDKAGNVRTQEVPTTGGASVTYTYTHDAWNRLVLADREGEVESTHQYNGLN